MSNKNHPGNESLTTTLTDLRHPPMRPRYLPQNPSKDLSSPRATQPCDRSRSTRHLRRHPKPAQREQHRAHPMSCEMYTPQEGPDGMLLERYGKLTMWKSKPPRLPHSPAESSPPPSTTKVVHDVAHRNGPRVIYMEH